MKRGHLFWAKYRQKSEAIDVQGLFNDYWGLKEREFTLSSQSRSPTSPLISDTYVEGSLTLESIGARWNYISLQTLLFVYLQLPIPTS